MTIERLKLDKVDVVAPLVIEFRITLRSYKGICSEYDIQDAKDEIIDYLDKQYPVFIALENKNA